MSPSRPSRYALRQANRSWLEIPCRRAVADASRRAEKLSSTIRSFSAADHRRRRPVSTISDVASVSKVIHTDNQLQAGQFGKTAYTGWIRGVARSSRNKDRPPMPGRLTQKRVVDQIADQRCWMRPVMAAFGIEDNCAPVRGREQKVATLANHLACDISTAMFRTGPAARLLPLHLDPGFQDLSILDRHVNARGDIDDPGKAMRENRYIRRPTIE
jgi:hypothetical protein